MAISSSFLNTVFPDLGVHIDAPCGFTVTPVAKSANSDGSVETAGAQSPAKKIIIGAAIAVAAAFIYMKVK